MINSALSISTAGMTHAANRLEDIANGIANPVADNAAQPAMKENGRDLQPTDPASPVASIPSVDPKRLVELVETEIAFKASAMATSSVVAASQDLMEALR